MHSGKRSTHSMPRCSLAVANGAEHLADRICRAWYVNIRTRIGWRLQCQTHHVCRGTLTHKLLQGAQPRTVNGFSVLIEPREAHREA